MNILKIAAATTLLAFSGIAAADNVSYSTSSTHYTMQGNLNSLNSDVAGWFSAKAWNQDHIIFTAYSKASSIAKSCRVYDNSPLWEQAKLALLSSTSESMYFYMRVPNGSSLCSDIQVSTKSQ